MIALDHNSALHARLASSCARCGVGGWHPEAAQCTEQNCGLSVVASVLPVGGDITGEGADLSIPLGSAPANTADVDSLFHAPENAR